MAAADIVELMRIDGEYRTEPWSAETFQKEIDNPLSRPIVLTVKEDSLADPIVGFAITWLVGDELQVHHLAVRQSARGQGWGGVLLNDVLEGAARLGGTQATLEVRAGNTPARRLYEKHGFVEVGRRPGYYRQPADDAILMTATLPRK